MRTLLLIIPFLVLGACRQTERDTPSNELIPAESARTVRVFRGDGTPARWDDLVAAVAGADAAAMGEQHGHSVGLAAAAALWRDVLAVRPTAALAMEFFERDEQSRVDEFLSGITDEAAFTKRTNRAPSPDGTPSPSFMPGHRDMVLACKESGRPVIAANAPRPYVRAARTKGFDALASLSENQRRLFRLPDALPTPESRYFTDFAGLMGADPSTAGTPEGDEKRAAIENSFRSQSVWDWTMAESVAGAMGHSRPVVLVVGQFHVDHHGGLLQALDRLRPGSRVVAVSFQDTDADSLRDEDVGRADYIVHTGPRTP